MKITIADDKIIVFLNKMNFKINYDDLNGLKDYFEQLIYKLQKKCNFLNSVFYNFDVYFDDYYGTILEITSDDNYYNYFKNIDIQVNIIKSRPFLYEMDYNFLDNNSIYYKKNSKFYLEPSKEDIELGKIIEYANIIYGDDIDSIIKNSEKVKYEKTICSFSGTT